MRCHKMILDAMICQDLRLYHPIFVADKLNNVLIFCHCSLTEIWPGEAPEVQLPDSLMRSPEFYFLYHEVWNAHWTRLVENAMDYVHLPFVHRNSFGGEIVKNATESGSFVEFEIERAEHSVRFFNRLHSIDSGYAIEPGFACEWYQPNLVVLKFDEMGIPIRMHSFAIPLDRVRTRYLLAFELLEPYSASVAQGFLDPIVEDRITIESQCGEIPTTTGECNVPSDRATLMFRRWYHQTFDRQVVQIE
jgi:phenylpropionate dioxygenase-like ring-hydroxylating dioxygenase large terminal subunit